MPDIGLSHNEIRSIRAVFSRYDPIDEVILYGSRAMGNHKPSSDIDLALKGSKIDLSLLIQIEFELDDLMLPVKFDLTHLDRITNPEFLDHIHRVGVEFYKKEQQKQDF